MRFMPLRHRSFQLMLLILSLYIMHAHYSELDATYGINRMKQLMWHKPHEAIHVIVGSIPEST